MGLVDKIKADVKKSGQNKSKFVYFREGQKVRLRFLTDMDDGLEVIFHDSFEQGVNNPCQEIFGRDCPQCEDESLRTRSLFVWSVYNYEAKEVQLFMFAVNNCSPVPALLAMYENYGTITDRDYVITVTGKQQNKTFSVVPMDKVKFRNEKAKAYSEKAVLKMLDKAFPFESSEEDEDAPKKKKAKASAVSKKASKKQDDYDEDDYDEESWGDEEDEVLDYEDMSAKELYAECRKRDIECKPKKSEKYYINLLEEFDEAQEDWGDEEDDEDEWEDE
ncbi:MAG: hypothetical protein J6R68_04010 [Clostridia bacterium]|nr:hypothetical protein [Clostridia bacterium]